VNARRFERPSLRETAGYVPGEQPESDEVVKLNTNENPYPPPPAVKAALTVFDLDRLRRYPQPTALDFRRVAGALHGVDPDAIIAANGSDELLRLAFATFVEPGEAIGILTPSYSLYPVLAELIPRTFSGCSRYASSDT
jgi:histidinol-phosphate aminotransferase